MEDQLSLRDSLMAALRRVEGWCDMDGKVELVESCSSEILDAYS